MQGRGSSNGDRFEPGHAPRWSTGPLRWLLTLSMLSLAVPGVAQESSPAEESRPDDESDAKPRSAGLLERIRDVPGDVIFLPAADGTLVPVPRGANLADYLEFLRTRKSATAEERESSHAVVRVAVEGTADDAVARLSVRFQVKVDREDGWVSVPLGLEQGVVRDYAYRPISPSRTAPATDDEGAGRGEEKPADENEDGESDASTDVADEEDDAGGEREPDAAAEPTLDGTFESFDRDDGLRWRFRGRGLHEVTVDVAVPVRFQSPTRRLVLDLPDTAVSSARIRVPLSSVVAKPVADVQASVKSEDDGTTLIEAFGLGTRFELSWEPRPKPKSTVVSMQAHTLVELRPNDRTVVMSATQTLQIVDGAVDRVRVSLPSDFEVRDLSARLLDDNGGEFRRFETSEEGDWAEVSLPSVLGPRGRVELRWTFESDEGPPSRRIRIDGLAVEGARSQTGEIAVMPLSGRQVISVDSGERNVHRIDVAELSRKEPAASAFRFLRQPFELVLDVRRIDPLFTSEPRFSLEARPDRLVLSGRFHVRVYRGAVGTVEIAWPNHAEDGWSSAPESVPGVVEKSEVVGSGADSRVRLELVQPRSGEFEIPFRAERMVESFDDPVTVQLPEIVDAQRLSPLLVLVRPVDVDATLTPSRETRTRPVPTNTITLPPSADDASVVDSAVRIEAGERRFQLELVRRSRTTSVVSETRPTLSDGVLDVEQRLEYDVRHGRLGELTVAAPAETAPELSFRLGDETPLPVRWESPDEGGSVVGRVALPSPQWRRFRVSVRRGSRLIEPAALEAGSTIDVPLVRPLNVDEFVQTCALPQPAPSALAWQPIGEWTPGPVRDGDRIWTADEPVTELSLDVRRRDESDRGNLVVRKALLRTVLFETGDERSRARFLLEGVLNRVVVSVPAETKVESIWWNEERLPESRIERSGDRYVVSSDAEPPEDTVLLTVVYHSSGGAPFSWVDARPLSPPTIANANWSETVVWEVSVPRDQLLLQAVPNYAANYTWRRRIATWSRQPREAFADPLAWIGAEAHPDEATEHEGTNTYQFSRFGPLEATRLSTTSRAFVILFGAGTALALGFVLLKIPATRHVSTLLVIGFALAVASLWYAEAVLLLLQPAALGLALAMVAATIDSALERRRRGAVVTFRSRDDVSPSDVFEASTRTQPPSDSGFGSGSGSSVEFDVRPASSHLSGTRGGP